MQVVMKPGAAEEEVQAVINEIGSYPGLEPRPSPGRELTVILIIGTFEGVDKLDLKEHLESFPGVSEVMVIASHYKLVSRVGGEMGRVTIAGQLLGNSKIQVIAGPCSVESEDQLFRTAEEVKRAGATFLRGGAFKPRTSPYGFRGLGEEGLRLLREARKRFDLPIVTEVMSPAQVDLALKYEVDVLQIGARNSQDFELLTAAGQSGKPVLLKNGLAGTLQDLLLSAEYVAYKQQSPKKIILCLRGIRTFETATRNTLDVTLVSILKEETYLPVFVDPSHAPGKWQFVGPLALAGIAAGADGLLVEVHPEPEKAKSDGPQQLKPNKFTQLMEQLRMVARAVGREI